MPPLVFKSCSVFSSPGLCSWRAYVVTQSLLASVSFGVHISTMFQRLSASALAQCLSFQRSASGELRCLLTTLVFFSCVGTCHLVLVSFTARSVSATWIKLSDWLKIDVGVTCYFIQHGMGYFQSWKAVVLFCLSYFKDEMMFFILLHSSTQIFFWGLLAPYKGDIRQKIFSYKNFIHMFITKIDRWIDTCWNNVLDDRKSMIRLYCTEVTVLTKVTV